MAPPLFTPTTFAGGTKPVSAKDAHDMLIGTGFGIVIVVLAIILAGQSDTWGSAMILLMILLLAIQGITHVSVFASFVQNNSFLPTEQTTSNETTSTKGILA